MSNVKVTTIAPFGIGSATITSTILVYGDGRYHAETVIEGDLCDTKDAAGHARCIAQSDHEQPRCHQTGRLLRKLRITKHHFAEKLVDAKATAEAQERAAIADYEARVGALVELLASIESKVSAASKTWAE